MSSNVYIDFKLIERIEYTIHIYWLSLIQSHSEMDGANWLFQKSKSFLKYVWGLKHSYCTRSALSIEPAVFVRQMTHSIHVLFLKQTFPQMLLFNITIQNQS